MFLRKFFLSLFLQFNTTIYTNEIQINKQNLDQYLSNLKSCFSKFDGCRDAEELCLGLSIINLYTLISAYSAQFQLKKSSSSTTIVHILKENSQYEKKLKSKFTQLYQICLERNVFQSYWLLGNLFDLFIASLMSYLNNSSTHSKYLQESLVDCLQTLSCFYSENSKCLHMTLNKQDVDTLSKSNFHKPIVFFNSVGKLIELLLKTSIFVFLIFFMRWVS